MSKLFYFTIDVDWIPGSDKGVGSVLEFCRQQGIISSLFIAGRFAVEYPEVIAAAAHEGCGIGSHGWEHGLDDGENFRLASYEDQRRWISMATDAIERASGVRPRMFRAPNLWVSETTLQVLLDLGYTLDSSVPARRYDFGYGQCNYVRYFRAPLAPYQPSLDHLGRRGDSPIIEVPPSAYGFVPVNMSALRVLGLRAVTWAARQLARHSLPIVFYLHPAEFVRPEDQEIPATDPARYLKGLGPQNLVLLDKFVSAVFALGYTPARLAELTAAAVAPVGETECHPVSVKRTVP